MMDVFVPVTGDCFFQYSEAYTIANMMRIDVRDLHPVMAFWEEGKNVIALPEDRSPYLTRTACQHPVSFGDYAQYMRRPKIVFFGGAFEGKEPKTAEILLNVGETLGRLCAEYGFSFRFGGGEVGVMGKVCSSYLDTIRSMKERGLVHPDQISEQVTAAHFLCNTSTNGNRPPNEGLSFKTDALVVLPNDIALRKNFMRVGVEAGMLAPGAIGSPDEWFDWMTPIKIGAANAYLGVVNPMVPCVDDPNKQEPYYADILNFCEKVTARGMITKEQFDMLCFPATNAQDAMDMLMDKLKKENRLPDQVWRENCERLAPIEKMAKAYRPAPIAQPFARGCALE